MTDWEQEREWYAQRSADSLDAMWVLSYAIGFATFIACWHFAAEWFFGLL